MREIVAEAHDGGLPILVHAGRGIPALGAHVLELAGEFPRARFILAHAGVCDLAWLWRRVEEFPNVFFDTAWFSVPDLLALFAHVAPGRILYATDIPFGSPIHGSLLTFRCALQAGLSPEQIAVVAHGQLERLVAGEEAIDAGPAPGPDRLRTDSLLDRVELLPRERDRDGDRRRATRPSTSTSRASRASSATTRRRRRSAARSSSCSSCIDSLEHGETLPERFIRIHVLVIAMVLASTPDVPVA